MSTHSHHNGKARASIHPNETSTPSTGTIRGRHTALVEAFSQAMHETLAAPDAEFSIVTRQSSIPFQVLAGFVPEIRVKAGLQQQMRNFFRDPQRGCPQLVGQNASISGSVYTLNPPHGPDKVFVPYLRADVEDRTLIIAGPQFQGDTLSSANLVSELRTYLYYGRQDRHSTTVEYALFAHGSDLHRG